MLQPATKCEIDARVKALNLTLKELARRAGIDPMTAYRGPKRLTTYGRLMRALEAEELRLRHHLIALHGLPDESERSAA